ncbi:MAG: 50S ribosomal protein L21 [Patescibacteria group bacterium]
MKFAVIETGGKQYRVSERTRLKVERFHGEAGGEIRFDKVLLVGEGDDVQIGTPYLSGVSVAGTVIREGRGKKEIVFKYHSKTRRRKKKGHRQYFTEVEIVSIK